MSNPVLNDKALKSAADRAGWAAPQPGTVWNPPVTDGPSSTWQTPGQTMTTSGTASATMVLLGLLLVSGYFGWTATDPVNSGLPGLALIGVLVGFVAVLIGSFKPQLARFLAPVYAVAEGFFLGAISKAYESRFDGIVLQAIGATLGVFAIMLVLHTTKTLRVTDKFRRTVMGATLGLMLFYGVSLLLRLFGVEVPFLNSTGPLGIAFSVFAAVLAAFNLSLDFDFIERGSQQRMPKHMEWYAAMGLLVTLVWLYLELLRLLSKLRD